MCLYVSACVAVCRGHDSHGCEPQVAQISIEKEDSRRDHGTQTSWEVSLCLIELTGEGVRLFGGGGGGGGMRPFV